MDWLPAIANGQQREVILAVGAKLGVDSARLGILGSRYVCVSTNSIPRASLLVYPGS